MIRILGELGVSQLLEVSSREIQFAVRAESDPASVVDVADRKPGHDLFPLAETERTGLAGQFETVDAIVLFSAVVGVQVALVDRESM